tara:strand:- start:34 stop:261 length:228 start_codon:yes stop_codon:yes gene_type:complete
MKSLFKYRREKSSYGMLSRMKLLEHTMHSLLFRCLDVKLFEHNDKVEMIAIVKGVPSQNYVEKLDDDCEEVKECR